MKLALNFSKPLARRYPLAINTPISIPAATSNPLTMKILDPQSATLTNAEVLAHFTLNPPRRSPTAPPNANPRIFVPSPDLRDHNTVVKEFQDYVSRISPHLMQYPSFYPKTNTNTSESKTVSSSSTASSQTQTQTQTQTDETPLDVALRELISRLKPYQLTKAEVLTMINLGIGLGTGFAGQEQGQEEEQVQGGGGEEGEQEDTVMQDAGAEGAVEGGGEGEGEGEVSEEDYGAMAILNTVIEDRVERLTDEDVGEILTILRETLGGKKSGGAES